MRAIKAFSVEGGAALDPDGMAMPAQTRQPHHAEGERVDPVPDAERSQRLRPRPRDEKVRVPRPVGRGDDPGPPHGADLIRQQQGAQRQHAEAEPSQHRRIAGGQGGDHQYPQHLRAAGGSAFARSQKSCVLAASRSRAHSACAASWAAGVAVMAPRSVRRRALSDGRRASREGGDGHGALPHSIFCFKRNRIL